MPWNRPTISTRYKSATSRLGMRGGAQRECIVWQSGLIGRQITGEVQHTLKGIAFELHLGKHDAQDERCHPDRYSSTCSRGYTRLRRRICSRHTTAWKFHAFQMPHTGQKCGKPTVLIIRSAHLRACMPPQPSCLPFPLPLGSPRQPSQKQRSNASLIGPSGIRPSKNARVLWGGSDSPTRGKLLEMAVALGVARYPESYENLGPLLFSAPLISATDNSISYRTGLNSTIS